MSTAISRASGTQWATTCRSDAECEGTGRHGHSMGCRRERLDWYLVGYGHSHVCRDGGDVRSRGRPTNADHAAVNARIGSECVLSFHEGAPCSTGYLTALHCATAPSATEILSGRPQLCQSSRDAC